MDQMARLLSDTEDRYSSPLRLALFGTTDPVVIAEALGEYVASTLGSIAEVRFLSSGVGLVVGCVLHDLREVVVKVHRWNVTTARLLAVQQVQKRLADEGLPAPRPLMAPRPLGSGIATIEELRSGTPADGHQPGIRNDLAAGLADFVDFANRINPTPAVGRSVLAPSPDGPLWGETHDLRFDFAATATGAEWIDELGQQAREVLVACQLPDVIAHLDWRVENLGFSGREITAIYDWDSVGLAPEAVAVGQAAAQFSTNWRIGPDTLPSLAAMRAFVDDYELHRGQSFDPEERAVLDAANLMLCAYGARCEHSDRILHPELAAPTDTGWEGLLRGRSAHGLA